MSFSPYPGNHKLSNVGISRVDTFPQERNHLLQVESFALHDDIFHQSIKQLRAILHVSVTVTTSLNTINNS